MTQHSNLKSFGVLVVAVISSMIDSWTRWMKVNAVVTATATVSVIKAIAEFGFASSASVKVVRSDQYPETGKLKS
jgi:hypothetical protein